MPETRTRELTLDCRAADAASRSVPATLSTDSPVSRGGYEEVLEHSANAVDLSRAPLPLIESHDLGTVNVGVVENLVLDRGRLRGSVRFGKSARATELLNDVVGGVVRGLSIGYQVFASREEMRDGARQEIITRWQPIELSVVAAPLDTNAGFFRSFEMEQQEEQGSTRSQRIASKNAGEAERERAVGIQKAGKAYARFGAEDLVAQYIEEGRSLEDFQQAILARVRATPAPSSNVVVDTRSNDLGLDSRDLRGYSLTRALRAVAFGKENRKLYEEAGLEMDVAAHMATRGTGAPKGLLVPMEIFRRDLTVGTATAGGHLVATNLLADQFVGTLDAMPQVQALGATMLPGLVGNVAIPRMTVGVAPAWLGAEAATYTESQPAFDQVTMTPKDVAVMTDMSRRLIMQSTPAIEQLVRRDLAKRLALAVDSAALNGSGASGQPTGLINVSGIGSVAGGTNGLAPTWAHVVNLMREVEIDNGATGRAAYLTNAQVKSKLLTTEKASSTAQFVWENGREAGEGIVAGYRAAVSSHVPSTLTKGSSSGICSAIFFGNWADLIIGMWGGLDLTVDPYTFSSNGTLRITAIQTIDIVVRHPESFSAMLDALTT